MNEAFGKQEEKNGAVLSCLQPHATAALITFSPKYGLLYAYFVCMLCWVCESIWLLQSWYSGGHLELVAFGRIPCSELNVVCNMINMFVFSSSMNLTD